MHYTAMVSREGEHTLAEFVDAPGCQTFAEPGEDVDALAADALAGWLEVHLEDGEAPPRPVAVPAFPAHAPAGAALRAVRVPAALAVRLELRWARQEAGLSQGEMAARVGVSRQAYHQLERPGANLRLSTLEKVAAALGRELVVALRPGVPA